MNSPIDDTASKNANEISKGDAWKYFFAVVGGFTLLWVVLPSLVQPAYRPDVIELMIAGKEWVLSTRKHPMLPAWFLEILNMLTNRVYACPFIASQICVFLTLFSVYSLARNVLSGRLALLGTFAMLPFWFFTVESIKYNQNTPLIAFWAISTLLVFRAFQTNRMGYWIAAGLSIGLAFNSKYTAFFLVVSILVYMLREPRIRTLWKSPGPYVTTLLAFLVFLPQLIWLYQNDFASLHNAGSQYKGEGALSHLYCPLKFIGTELLYLVLPMAILVPALGIRWEIRRIENGTEKECERFLFYCMMVPMLMHVLISGVMRFEIIGDYAAAFWSFLGVYLLMRFRAVDTPAVFSRGLRNLFVAESLMVALILVQSICGPYLTGKHSRFHFPKREIGAICEKIWDERFEEPCPFITGDWWLAGNAAFSMPDRPRVLFYYGNMNNPNTLPTGTWAEDADVNEQGGMILWEVDHNGKYKGEKKSGREDEPDYVPDYVPDYLFARFPDAEVLNEEFTIPYKTRADVPPLRFRVAIIPPSGKGKR